MAESLTLLETLERAGARVSVYDIGRRVGDIGRACFLAFEQARAPYPLPMQRKAWFALVQRPDALAVPVVWFLRLGLDEQGLLVQAQRDYLLERLLESAHARCGGADPHSLLCDNPFAFRPGEERMGLFHARLGADLGLSPSRYYAHALDYFRGGPGWAQWRFVGYQGIADVACRCPDQPLSTAIPQLPAEPLVALCHCLESACPAAALIEALLERLQDALSAETADTRVIAALVRGVSAHAARPAVVAGLQGVLAHPVGKHIEILAAVSGRAWEALSDPDLLRRYLLRLAENDHGQTAFAHCLTDLLSLPDMAPVVRTCLRAPDLAEPVRQAFARMTEAGA